MEVQNKLYHIYILNSWGEGAIALGAEINKNIWRMYILVLCAHVLEFILTSNA